MGLRLGNLINIMLGGAVGSTTGIKGGTVGSKGKGISSMGGSSTGGIGGMYGGSGSMMISIVSPDVGVSVGFQLGRDEGRLTFGAF